MSPDKFISIRDKLNHFAARLLITAMVVFILSGMCIGVINFSNSVQREKAQFFSSLVSTGHVLVTNNSKAVRGLAADNAIGSIRELIASTVKAGKDIEYGIFMDQRRLPWAIADANSPHGVPSSLEPMNDTMSLWAAHVEELAEKKGIYKNKNIIEFAAAVTDEEGRLGTVRYGVSTEGFKDQYAQLLQMAILTSLAYPLLFLIIGLLLFIFQSRIAQKQAQDVTDPIHQLTNAAQQIASGTYNQPVPPSSNDEVGLLAQSFESMRVKVQQYTENLEQMVAQRTAELRAAQRELIEKAHRAGMADIATGTLHNVGNILNSVHASSEAILEVISRSALPGFAKANQLVADNRARLADFFSADPRGTKLVEYFGKLDSALVEEHQLLLKSSNRLMEKVNAIAEVVAAQQNYAGVTGLDEEATLSTIIEDALTMLNASLDKIGIQINRDYQDVPMVIVQKTKLVHIVFNLLKNAKEAVSELPVQERLLSITLSCNEKSVFARFSDNGFGIVAEDLARIFNHGFTTKKSGHGFGLHSSANYMTEMGGQLWAESAGLGKGSTFILRFDRLVVT